MYFPSVDDLAVFEDVVMRMLCSREAGMVRENPNAVANFIFFHAFTGDRAVLLRHSSYTHSGIIAF